MGTVRENYVPSILAANSSTQVRSGAGELGGFLCTTAGTITVYDGIGASGKIIDTMAVTAGVFHSMPFGFGTGLYVVLAGGGAGTMATV